MFTPESVETTRKYRPLLHPRVLMDTFDEEKLLIGKVNSFPAMSKAWIRALEVSP